MSLAKPKRVRAPKYRRAVMKNECCVVAAVALHRYVVLGDKFQGDEWRCAGECEFHHVKPYGGGITGGKVSDYRGVKVCQKHHRMAAQRRKFEQVFGIDLESEIERLNKLYTLSTVEKPRQKILIARCICGKSHTLYSCPVEKEARRA